MIAAVFEPRKKQAFSMRSLFPRYLLCCLAIVLFSPSSEGFGEALSLKKVVKIWEKAPHNAFTDLIRFKGQWICVFREGKGHVSPDGRLRVIGSAEGHEWQSLAVLDHPKADLRDAKICLTPGGDLMLSGAAAWHDQGPHTHQTLAWYSDDGENWTEAQAIGEPDLWLWRTNWDGDLGLGIGYKTRGERFVRLYQTGDGRRFEVKQARLFEDGYANESSIVFDDEVAYCLLRRDGEASSAQWGKAKRPFLDWQWTDMGVRLGGPHMVKMRSGRIYAVVRLYDGGARTSVCRIEKPTGKLIEVLPLPSGGDTSYAGIVDFQGQLWISYYSSHENKTAIYLAIVDVLDDAKGLVRPSR